MNLKEIILQPVQQTEQKRFQALMEAHHYLGALAKIGHTIWYVASFHGEWLALISFSAAAWKCAARDQWIGWNYRYQYDRLHLLANNSRFLILPEHHYPNLASPCSFPVRTAHRSGLAGTLWLSIVAVRDFRGSAGFSWHYLSCRQWVVCG